MRRIPVLVWAMAAVTFFPAITHARCRGIAFRVTAESGDSGVSLADLLTEESCPELRRAAASVWLGNSPLSGGKRVFEGGEIRRALQQLMPAGISSQADADVFVPERIVVRRSGAKASCQEIEDFLERTLRARTDGSSSSDFSPQLDCGRANRIPRDAPLELVKVFWDPALQAREYSLRCARAGECVPFLIREIPAGETPTRKISSADDSGRAWFAGFTREPVRSLDAAPVVQIGQAATFYWEQDGIRAVLPVICLDRGAVGTLIRVRTRNGNRILRAQVVSAGVLRAAL